MSNEPTDPALLGRADANPAIAYDLFFTLVWPAAAAVSLSVAVGGRDVTGLGLLSIACGTMAAYGLDRLIDRRHHDSARLRRALRVCVILAATATAVLACTDVWRFQVCAVLAVIAATYVPLKKFIPKNALTVFGWTAATATLPFAGQPPLDPAFGASVLAVALIMGANTVICDLPDVEADRRSRVVGITPKFGARAGAVLAFTCGCLGALAAGSAGRWGLATTAFALAVLAILVVRSPGRGLFRFLADGLIVVVPGPMALLFR